MMRHRLIHSAALAALALFMSACDDEPAPPFTVEGTGSVSGQLFYDADNNGQFTPIGGDTLLVGVPLRLVERADNDVIAETTTSAAGTFTFAGVPLGTHSLQVMATPEVTGALVFCTNPVPASVYADENRFLAVAGKLGCVIPIAQAEAQVQGTNVTITGIVTTSQGDFRGDNAYIQDLTGGMNVFGISASLGLQRGDSIEVTGVLSNFGGELQINSPRITTIKRGVGEVAARERTASQMATATPLAADVGRLLVIRGATVTNLTSATDRDGTITDATGSVALRLDSNALTTFPLGTFQAGKCYDITGILGIFNGTAQLKPRIRTDVVEVTCP